jgi:hypothetical protein
VSLLQVSLLSVILGGHFAEFHSALCYSTELNSDVILMSHSDEHNFGEYFYVECHSDKSF